MRKFAKIALGTFGTLVACLWMAVFFGENGEGNVAEEVAYNVTQPPAAAAPVLAPEPAVPMKTTEAKPALPRIKLDDLDDAEKAIRLAINVSGHLCAKPTEVREVGPSLYGVHCITNRDGTGRSNYLVNSRTNEVDRI